MGLLGALAPPGVATAEIVGDPPPASELLPAERVALGRVAERRAGDFTGGRVCARAALAVLDAPPGPLLPGLDRYPHWPAGFTGSITHCAGYCGAAVASTERVDAVGVDAEPHHPLPAGVGRLVASGRDERAELVRQHTRRPGVYWDRVLFSAKEAVYKAWYPVTRDWLDFADVAVRFDPPGRFRAGLSRPGPVVNLDGRYAVRRGLVLTIVVLPRRPG